MNELEQYKTKLIILKRENQKNEKENQLLKIELDARKREPYWEKECIIVAQKYGWTEELGFSNGNAKAFRKEMSGRCPYIEIKALREKYVIIKYNKLVDEDTLDEIIDPHDKILHHICSGTYNPRGFCKWDNIKIKHRENDRCYLKS